MVTRILLVQPKSEEHSEAILAVLQRLHQLRQCWPGIIDLETGATTSSVYPYGAVLRFVQPYVSIRVVSTPDYREVISELERHATVLSFDMENEDKEQPEETGSIMQPPAYGLFAPTIEEQLRSLIYYWFQGIGQPLTSKTIMADLPQPDDFGLSLLEFSSALEQQFGVESVSDILWSNKATFGDLLSMLETKLAEEKKQTKDRD